MNSSGAASTGHNRRVAFDLEAEPRTIPAPSDRFPRHPLSPLATTVADFNFDALDADGRAPDVSVRGGNQLFLEDDLVATSSGHGRYFSPEPDPGPGRFYRPDPFSFPMYGVQAISIIYGRQLL